MAEAAETKSTPDDGLAVTTAESTVNLPRIAIKFCTQCKWNLRAAYVSQPTHRRNVTRTLLFTTTAAPCRHDNQVLPNLNPNPHDPQPTSVSSAKDSTNPLPFNSTHKNSSKHSQQPSQKSPWSPVQAGSSPSHSTPSPPNPQHQFSKH
jgi:hypothetical protein